MGKNESVSMESLMKICATLNCNIGDIVDFYRKVRNCRDDTRNDGSTERTRYRTSSNL
ncbi:helix-turn-helix transcriptional regulator [Gemmiger formicilis]|nr:helix-turn-helix transcriptional regulator [Gemmiger formicilis]